MTPKLKAEELVNKFGEYTVQESWQSKNYFAIECALIAVDELINNDFAFESLKSNSLNTKYWYEVQQEIQKL